MDSYLTKNTESAVHISPHLLLFIYGIQPVTCVYLSGNVNKSECVIPITKWGGGGAGSETFCEYTHTHTQIQRERETSNPLQAIAEQILYQLTVYTFLLMAESLKLTKKLQEFQLKPTA
jgi:hypothetical protein